VHVLALEVRAYAAALELPREQSRRPVCPGAPWRPLERGQASENATDLAIDLAAETGRREGLLG
jgi:hypothetical protein